MATTIKLKNSVVKDKVPLPSGLEIGELAVGAHSESPALFFKDNADNIIKLEPGGSGVEPSPTPPVGPDEGDLWYDTGKNTLNYWDGASWVELGQAGDSPVTSVNGEVGVVVLDAADVGALAPGDNVSELANDAGYLTGADGDGFVDVDGDNMTGDLTLGTDKITLDASDGSITAAGGKSSLDSFGNFNGVNHYADQTLASNATFAGALNGVNTFVAYADGSATFAGNVYTDSAFFANPTSDKGFQIRKSPYNSTDATATIFTDGSAIFAGKVTANSFDIEALPALPA